MKKASPTTKPWKAPPARIGIAVAVATGGLRLVRAERPSRWLAAWPREKARRAFRPSKQEDRARR
jgi:hypothetical protein